MRKFSLLTNLIALMVSGISLFGIIMLLNMQSDGSDEETKKNTKEVGVIKEQMVQVQDFITSTNDRLNSIEGDVDLLHGDMDKLQKEHESILLYVKDKDEQPAPPTPAEPKDEPKADPAKKLMSVTVTQLHFRKDAGFQGEIITRLDKGETVTDLGHIEKKDNFYWRKIDRKGTVGWVASRYLE